VNNIINYRDMILSLFSYTEFALPPIPLVQPDLPLISIG
jgi:hypothetical protein